MPRGRILASKIFRDIFHNSFLSGVLALVVTACSTFHSVPSERYESYIDDKVETLKLLKEGREVLIARALAATKELHDEQELYAPGHSFAYDPHFLQVIVALSLGGRELFDPSDFKFLLDGQKVDKVQEILSITLLQTLYPFAFPFHRVLLLNFPLNNSASQAPTKKLDVESIVGKATLNVDFSRAEKSSETGAETGSK